ncbi:MAG: hypothetical protein QM632_06260 [Micrococcaceae bacterium]
MYGFIWKLLPGPRWMKFLLALLLLVAVLWFLMNVFFPWLSTVYPLSNPQVETGTQ